METRRSEYPKHPFPHIPQPEQPQQLRVHAPAIFVYEKQAWEYRVISKDVNDGALAEHELNAFGAAGWELVGVVTLTTTVQFYFKRVRS
jgi:hypothetical protein